MHFHKQSDKILILNLFYQGTLSLAVELLPHSHLTFIIPSSHPPKRVSAIVTVSIAGILWYHVISHNVAIVYSSAIHHTA